MSEVKCPQCGKPLEAEMIGDVSMSSHIPGGIAGFVWPLFRCECGCEFAVSGNGEHLIFRDFKRMYGVSMESIIRKYQE